MPPLTKWKNQQHWSQVSTFNPQCWNFESTDMLHNIKGREKKNHAHQGFDTLLLAKYPAVLCIFNTGKALGKTNLISHLGFAKCLGAIKTPGTTTKFPFQAPHHTVLHWHAAFTITICLIPGLFQPCYLVLILEFPMVLHFMRVTGYLLSSQPAYNLF
jgi:hypothetical protein